MEKVHTKIKRKPGKWPLEWRRKDKITITINNTTLTWYLPFTCGSVYTRFSGRLTHSHWVPIPPRSGWVTCGVTKNLRCRNYSYTPGLLWPPCIADVDIIMAALCNRGAIIFLPCSFFLSSFYLLLFFFPRLISAAVDWMSAILLHMAWP